MSIQLFGPASGPSPFASDRRDGLDQRKELFDIRGIGPRQGLPEGNACGIGQQVVLATRLGPVGGVGTGFASCADGSHRGAVDHGVGPVDLAGALQLGQQHFLEPIPDPGLLPVAQASPTGHPRATAHLLGKRLPGDAGLEDKEDAGQRLAVVHRLAPGEAEPPWFGRREKRFDHLPQFVVEKRLGHGCSSYWQGTSP